MFLTPSLERDHVPLHGVFLALLAYGSQRRTAPEVSWLPSPRDLATGGRVLLPAR